jgi:hypothetical protein
MTLEECLSIRANEQSQGGMGHITGAKGTKKIDKLEISHTDIQVLLAFKNTLDKLIEKETLLKSSALKKRERAHNTNLRREAIEKEKKQMQEKIREKSQKYLDENKRLKKEVTSLTSKRTKSKSKSGELDKIKEAKKILRSIKFYGKGELNMERVGDLRELFGLQRYG